MNSLDIVQTATINLENITFENAQVKFEVTDFNDQWNPIFKGKFNNTPSIININKISNERFNPIVNKEYTLMSGMFEENSCENWIKIINFGNTGFDSKDCIINDPLLAYENKRIVIKANSLNDEKSNKKLNGGQIAGIVIGCIALIVLCILVVFFIIKWKNNRNKSESQDQIDNENEL